MNSSTNSRVATESDLAALTELFVAFRDSLKRTVPAAAEFERSLAVLLKAPDVRIYVAEEKDRAVGYAAQRFLFTAWAAGEEALLEDLFVREECRGRGIARQLIEHAIRDATARGCRSMWLDTNERNDASNALYRRMGFTCERARWGGGRQIRHDLKLLRG